MPPRKNERVFDEENIRIGILGDNDESMGWNVFWERPYSGLSRQDVGVVVDGRIVRMVQAGELDELRERCKERARIFEFHVEGPQRYIAEYIASYLRWLLQTSPAGMGPSPVKGLRIPHYMSGPQ